MTTSPSDLCDGFTLIEPIETDAAAVCRHYREDPAAAARKYSGRIVQIAGRVTQLRRRQGEAPGAVLEGAEGSWTVECLFETLDDCLDIRLGEQVTLLGECSRDNPAAGDLRLQACTVLRESFS